MISTIGSWGGKPLVEAGTMLRVRDLRSVYGFFARHTLTAADGTTIELRLKLNATYGWIRFEHTRPGQAWPEPGYDVSIIATPQHFGGLRWRFDCPHGEGPCSVLHLPPGADQFASRQAHGLAFASQRLRAPARAVVRAQRVRLGLGGSADLDVPFPERPKGMHAATYERRRSATFGVKALR